jgi:hypothetical protein
MEQVQRLKTGLDQISRRLRKVRTPQVNTASDKKYVQDLVKEYFGELRPALESVPGAENKLTALDSKMQDLLRCTHQRTSVDKYRSCVQECKRLINDLEVFAIASRGTRAEDHVFGAREQKILSSLEKMKLSAAASSYKQGLDDLGAESRWSWRGTVVEFREALRETLDAMAPDEEVEKVAGFQLEAGAYRPTMRQKALFVLRSRGRTSSQAKSAADAVTKVDAMMATFVRSVYDRASYGVHNQVTREEAVRVKDYVTLVLGELLEIGE